MAVVPELPATVLRPFDSTGRGEQVAQRLADAIALGLLRDGQRLPSEAQLAASLAVAVTTVREGLALLREDGLLRTERGRRGGSFVVAPPEATSAVLERRLAAVSLAQLRDLSDHLAIVLGGAARLAAARAEGTDHAQLRSALAAAAAADGSGAFSRAATRLHSDLAAAGQSAMLTRAVIAVQGELAPLLALAYDGPTLRTAAVRRLQAILDHVEAADADRARSAAEDHVMTLFELVRARRAGRRAPR